MAVGGSFSSGKRAVLSRPTLAHWRSLSVRVRNPFLLGLGGGGELRRFSFVFSLSFPYFATTLLGTGRRRQGELPTTAARTVGCVYRLRERHVQSACFSAVPPIAQTGMYTVRLRRHTHTAALQLRSAPYRRHRRRHRRDGQQSIEMLRSTSLLLTCALTTLGILPKTSLRASTGPALLSACPDKVEMVSLCPTNILNGPAVGGGNRKWRIIFFSCECRPAEGGARVK